MRLGSFFRNVLAMASGTALAQAIPIITAPLLARLFSPADFGLFATVVALSGIVSVLSTGRYELAIILPEKEADAKLLFGLALGLALSICLFAFLLGAILWPWIGSDERINKIGSLVLVVPVLAFLLASGQIANAFANRHKRYKRMAVSAVSQQAAASVVTLVLGALKFTSIGLIAGRLVGVFVYVAMFHRSIKTVLSDLSTIWSAQSFRRLAWSYRQFPLFNMPYSVLGGISRDLLIFAFTFFNMTAAAGMFALTRMVLTAPIQLISSSISQVFYREAAEHADTPEFRRLMYRLLVASACIFVPAFAVLAWWAPDVFAVVFGERWRQAGRFAAPLCASAAMFSLTCWPGRIFEVRRKQHLALIIQASFDVVTVIIIALLLSNSVAPLMVVAAYAILQTGFHLVYLGTIFHLSLLSILQYLQLVVLIVGLAVASLLIGVILPSLQLGGLITFILHTLLVGFASTAILVVALRKWGILTLESFRALFYRG